MKNPHLSKLLFWWQGRSARERTVLQVWSVTVSVLLLWFGLIAPLMQRIATLEQRVPTLEVQLNKMRARPVASQRPASLAEAVGGDLRSTLFGALAEKKISAELRALSTTRVEMRLPELPIKEGLDLLDTLRQASGARVAVLNLKAEDAPGSPVRLVVELERTP